ncbi:hypothetical protein BDV98DRAFT_570805 [Pterulicium gracile]|uniref:Thioredoxin domain-containing protein n=1 Tax=Pterulicium gracile TaxID=1884261 RepID=A0A5C3QDI8_9AGAR|nr:hypothetical protein BDV98DRAFT_570805 [Pterula gracilis]
MPLQTANAKTSDEISLIRKNYPNNYLIFYSDVDGEKMWCPDCVRIEGIVKDTFNSETAEGTIVYVGLQHEWKSPSNLFRREFGISSVPTIVKLQDGTELGKLEDGEITKESLGKFVNV